MIKAHLDVFAKQFFGIKDMIFGHSYTKFESGESMHFRPTPDSDPMIVRTSSPEDYKIVVPKLEIVSDTFDIELIEGTEAVPHLKQLVSDLEKIEIWQV